MYESSGVVVAIGAQHIAVRAARKPDCSLCQQGKGCGGGLLPRLLADQHSTLRISSSADGLNVGDRVVIGVRESTVVAALARVLLPPLVGMFALSIIVAVSFAAAPNVDGWVALAAGAGLALGLWWSRGQMHRLQDAGVRPQVLRRLAARKDSCS